MSDLVRNVMEGLREYRVTPYNDPVPSDYVVSRQSMESALLEVQEVEREEIVCIIDDASNDFDGYDFAQDDTRAEFARDVVEAFAVSLIARVRRPRHSRRTNEEE